MYADTSMLPEREERERDSYSHTWSTNYVSYIIPGEQPELWVHVEIFPSRSLTDVRVDGWNSLSRQLTQ